MCVAALTASGLALLAGDVAGTQDLVRRARLAPGAPTTSTPSPPPFNPDHSATPVAEAIRTSQTITLDGRLDEAAWMEALPVSDLWQFEPDEGVPVSEPTEVRFLYDDNAIYVGAWLWDRDGIMPTRLGRRDVAMADTELFAVHFDTYHDHRTSYRFAVNPSAARRDQAASAGGALASGDASWNPVWEIETSMSEDGWFVEMRIPFSQLRFSQDEEQTWGLQLERKLRPVQENTVWAYTPRSEAQGQGRFGHLVGLRGIKPGRPFEVLPYLSARAEYAKVPRSPGVGFDNPFREPSSYNGFAGLDLKFRVTSNLTLDASVNPDFGQVEADPAVINLTAFETRFDERRPFFIEGAEIFDFGDGTTELFYSRRIGRAPQGSVPSQAVYDFTPGTTTILGAGKLTGKTAGGWSLGVVEAVTGREYASWQDASTMGGELEVEPLSNYLAGRAGRELREGQTTFGMMATAVHRDLTGSPLENRLHSAAYTGGVDFSHEFADRMWALDVQFSSSQVSGSTEALVRTQQTSARYYQRPDASYTEVDSAATSLTGYAAYARLQKQAGLWRFGAVASAVSPGHEINDLGFQSIADRIEAGGSLGYEQTRRGAYFLNWSLRLSPSVAWNYGGDRVGTTANVVLATQLPNFSRVNLQFNYNPEKLNGRMTRGGPIAQDPTAYSGTLNFNTDTRTRLTGRLALGVGGDQSGAWNRSATVTVAYKATERLDFSLGPSLGGGLKTTQYVTSVSDSDATSTFGRRYVFGDLRQTTLSMDARVNVTLSPEMSIEFYAQPFISSGDYGDMKELSAPRSYDMARYGRDTGTITSVAGGTRLEIDPDGAGPAQPFRVNNGDFNFRSLLSNLVFRWEWRPGSTFYAVWQQVRSGTLDASDPTVTYARAGDFRLGQDAGDLFRLRPDNIFQLKASFWLNP